ncbi:MAG: VOC family protein [Acidimicrobiales bacterium]
MGSIRLDQVNIVVGDMDAAADFYGRLGLDVERGDPDWSAHHCNTGEVGAHRREPAPGAEVDLDSAAFAAVWNRGWPGGTGVVLGFRTEDRSEVDRLHADLTAAGYVSQQVPYDAFWGARYAVVEDPDGHSVGLMSPADPVLRSAPPDPPA